MLKIVGIMLSGVLVGYLLRNRNLSFVSKGIMDYGSHLAVAVLVGRGGWRE